MHPRNFVAIPLSIFLFTAIQTSHSQNWPAAPIAMEEMTLDETSAAALVPDSPLAATADLLDQVAGMRSMAGVRIPALDKAVLNLQGATATNLWIDDASLAYPAGSKAFSSVAKALTGLSSFSKKQPTLLDSAQVGDWGGELAEQYRMVAYEKIVEAARDGISVQKLYGAWKQYLSGQQDLSAGKTSNAISHYGSAWKQAAKMRVKLLHTQN